MASLGYPPDFVDFREPNNTLIALHIPLNPGTTFLSNPGAHLIAYLPGIPRTANMNAPLLKLPRSKLLKLTFYFIYEQS